MRYTETIGRTVLVLAAVMTAVTLLAGVAHAQVVVTTTQTYNNPLRNTYGTITTTSVDGVLTSRTLEEVSRTTGLVTQTHSWTYWPNGNISHEEWITYTMNGTSHTMMVRDYYESGIISDLYVQIVSNGETIGELFTSYDVSGTQVYYEERILKTYADGTREWYVTVDPDGDGVLASYTKTYPYGYDFNATLPERPGYGYGDENHKHTGAPGQAEGASPGANGNGSGGASDPAEERPGFGHGDENHDHIRGRSQEFVK